MKTNHPLPRILPALGAACVIACIGLDTAPSLVPDLFAHPASQQTIEQTKPLRAHALKGVVVDRSGARLPQVRVERLSQDGKKTLEATLSDETGAFSLKAEPAGTYMLKASKRGYDSLIVHVTVSDKAKEELKLELSLRN